SYYSHTIDFNTGSHHTRPALIPASEKGNDMAHALRVLHRAR
ncbi:unnamed protein product, partial [Tetraodon nigroviridis]